MFFDEELMSTILAKTDLIALVQKEVCTADNNVRIVSIRGRKYLSNCPFCTSKYPAASISSTKYQCYSCGKGGNAIDFVMGYHNKSFVQSVEYLAKELDLATGTNPFSVAERSRKEVVLQDIVRESARYYFSYLRSNDGEKGMEYFESREDSPYMNSYFGEGHVGEFGDRLYQHLASKGYTVKEASPYIRSHFGVGYAGEFGDRLYQYLLSKGYTVKDMLDAGVISKSTKENSQYEYYDKFYGRVIFPIVSANNKAIGFGGRILGDGKPKYLNSPESQIFDKGKNLYGFNIAQKSTAPYFIACEGYMDVMALHQFGFDSAVASLGTALTREQVKLLAQKQEVILAYDSDEPGIKAAKKAILLCRERGLTVKVIQFNGAKDPDEFLKKFGAEALHKLIRNAESDKHFLIRNSKTAEGKFDFDKAVEELP